MSRFALVQVPAQERGLRETEDGDSIFVGMDQKTPREYLPPGYYPVGINKRCADGRVSTRGGTVTPQFANALVFGTILGTGIYRNPNGQETLLVATPNNVYGVADQNYPVTIGIPTTVTLSGPCTFDQNFDKVYLNNANATLVWNGFSSAFDVNSQQNPSNTTLSLTPNVPWSQNVADRRVFPLGVDQIGATGILDYTEYDNILGVFRVNTGTSDPIVGAFPYGLNNLLIGKRNSWDILANFTGDLSQASIQTLSNEIGLVSRKAVKMVGADVIFPFDTGVYRIQQVIQDRIAASAIPVAAFADSYGNVVDPIEPLLKRINWQYSSNITAEVVSPYYFLAVPLDGSTTNNAILVYNTIKDKWEGVDQWKTGLGTDLISIDELLVTRYLGVYRLFCVDKVAGVIYVLYEGKTDLLPSGEYQVRDRLETRGFSTQSSLNQYKRVEIGCSTWNPSVVVSELTDKYNDERPLNLVPITKDAAKSGIFGVAPTDVSNVNSDFDNVGRQDYSIGDGTYFDNGGPGINIDQTQQSVLRFATMARARWISYRIDNTQGQIAIDGILMKAAPAQRQQGSVAA